MFTNGIFWPRLQYMIWKTFVQRVIKLICWLLKQYFHCIVLFLPVLQCGTRDAKKYFFTNIMFTWFILL